MRAAPKLLSLVIAGAVAFPLAPISANEHRSREVTREFQRERPCHSTGRTRGPCPGDWKDHVVPIACGGPDTVSNPQRVVARGSRPKIDTTKIGAKLTLATLSARSSR